MAKFLLDFQTEIEVVTPGELGKALQSHGDAMVSAFLRGIKHMKLPRLRGQAATGVLTLGIQPPESGPASGFAWSVRRLAVTGLTAGVTPDVVGFYRNGNLSDLLWQLTGNSPVEKFGHGQIVLNGGDTLVCANIGTFAATGVITVSGEVSEVPEEMLGKIA